jgi:hypothetical protein
MLGMKFADADALVLSACAQMPSLSVVQKVEALTRKPVITASIATTYAMLKALYPIAVKVNGCLREVPQAVGMARMGAKAPPGLVSDRFRNQPSGPSMTY